MYPVTREFLPGYVCLVVSPPPYRGTRGWREITRRCNAFSMFLAYFSAGRNTPRYPILSDTVRMMRDKTARHPRVSHLTRYSSFRVFNAADSPLITLFPSWLSREYNPQRGISIGLFHGISFLAFRYSLLWHWYAFLSTAERNCVSWRIVWVTEGKEVFMSALRIFVETDILHVVGVWFASLVWSVDK